MLNKGLARKAIPISLIFLALVCFIAFHWDIIDSSIRSDLQYLKILLKVNHPFLSAILIITFQIIQSIVIVLPFTPITVVAGWLFGALWGFLICWIGIIIGQLICFMLARNYGLKVLSKYLGVSISPRIYARLSSLSSMTLILLYASGLISFDLISYYLGITSINRNRYILIMTIGVMPKILALSVLGDAINIADVSYITEIVAIILALGLIGTIIARRCLFHTK